MIRPILMATVATFCISQASAQEANCQRGSVGALAGCIDTNQPAAEPMAAGSFPQTAPFGLAWGVGTADFEKYAIRMTATGESSNGASFMVSNLPKPIKDTKAVMASFGPHDQLWRVTAVSADFDNDPAGAGIKARYEALKELLTERYGKAYPSESEPKNPETNAADRFVGSLLKNERTHYTNWRVQDTLIQLSIRATSDKSAYYTLLYEYTPLKSAPKVNRKSGEKDAL